MQKALFFSRNAAYCFKKLGAIGNMGFHGLRLGQKPVADVVIEWLRARVTDQCLDDC